MEVNRLAHALIALSIRLLLRPRRIWTACLEKYCNVLARVGCYMVLL